MPDIAPLEIETIETPAVFETPESTTQVGYAPMYWIVMHDDPITTMEFVVKALIDIFGYEADRAFETMYSIHTTGLAKIAVLPLERAEMKVVNVHRVARQQGFPLTCSIEPDHD